MSISRASFNTEATEENIQDRWGWFMALGACLVAMGIFAFANLLTATAISILYIGVFMSLGGLFQIGHSFQVRSWSGFFYYLTSGFLYAIAGVIAFQNPILAVATLTFFLSIALISSGLVRVWSSLGFRPQIGWGWTLASGLTTILAGVVFAFGWPDNSLWLLGMVLAIDLTFQGVSAVALGFTLKSLNRISSRFSKAARSSSSLRYN